MAKKPSLGINKANAHNVKYWKPSLKNSARKDPGSREVDTLNPSHRPAAVKAAKNYVKAAAKATAADKAKDLTASTAANKEGSRIGNFLRANGGTPTGVYKKVGENGSSHGSWEGIYF